MKRSVIIIGLIAIFCSISFAQPPAALNVAPPGFSPGSNDEIVSFYEQYATGVRISIPELSQYPNSEPYIVDINQALMRLDRITASYRDSKNLSLSGQPVLWDLPTGMNLLKKEVALITAATKSIYKLKEAHND